MAKKKKPITKVVNEAPRSVRGMNKLKEGMEVLYKTFNLMDKTTVVQVNKENNTAKLSNNVIVGLGYGDDGVLIKIGGADVSCRILVWNEECDLELAIFQSRVRMNSYILKLKQLTEGTRSASDPGAENLIKITEKLEKTINKYSL